jgi:hypothetical protein
MFCGAVVCVGPVLESVTHAYSYTCFNFTATSGLSAILSICCLVFGTVGLVLVLSYCWLVYFRGLTRLRVMRALVFELVMTSRACFRRIRIALCLIIAYGPMSCLCMLWWDLCVCVCVNMSPCFIVSEHVSMSHRFWTCLHVSSCLNMSPCLIVSEHVSMFRRVWTCLHVSSCLNMSPCLIVSEHISMSHRLIVSEHVSMSHRVCTCLHVSSRSCLNMSPCFLEMVSEHVSMSHRLIVSEHVSMFPCFIVSEHISSSHRVWTCFHVFMSHRVWTCFHVSSSHRVWTCLHVSMFHLNMFPCLIVSEHVSMSHRVWTCPHVSMFHRVWTATTSSQQKYHTCHKAAFLCILLLFLCLDAMTRSQTHASSQASAPIVDSIFADSIPTGKRAGLYTWLTVSYGKRCCVPKQTYFPQGSVLVVGLLEKIVGCPFTLQSDRHQNKN